jgi:hypothetical protein
MQATIIGHGWRMALVALGAASISCGGNDAGPPAHAAPPPTFHFTPHAEDWRTGPVGTGLSRCELYVYAWDNAGHCRVQLNHCALEEEGSSEVVCMSLADERTIPCGGTTNACGQLAQCDCPTGAPPIEPEAPGTFHFLSGDRSRTFQSADYRCTAMATGLPGGGEGPPPAPCIISLRECPPAGPPCVERIQMLSCGIRSDLCGRPVRCDCPSEDD